MDSDYQDVNFLRVSAEILDLFELKTKNRRNSLTISTRAVDQAVDKVYCLPVT